MVRLKVGILRQNQIVIFYFNSSMVRLKETMINERGWCNKVFQFQYGAIKRQINLPSIQLQLHFNSSMVRLKVS